MGFRFRVLVVHVILTTVVAHVMSSGVNMSDCRVGMCQCQTVEDGVKVVCLGPNVTSVPQNIPRNVSSLSLRKTNIPKLSSGDFHLFRDSLQQLIIQDDPILTTIEPGTFDGLNKLHSLDIYDCKGIKELKKGVLGTFSRLSSIKLIRCGLTQLPDFTLFSRADPVNLDLSDNSFHSIPSHSFANVQADDLLLENCNIREIKSYAFNSTKAVRIRLRNNPNLHHIHPTAFEGIQGLKTLDLSQTTIWSLPTGGLGTLENLILQNVPSLRKLPNTFKFQSLKVAKLTYKHHCCAFKDPKTQNPAEYTRFIAEKEKEKQECMSGQWNAITTPGYMGSTQGYLGRYRRDGFGFGQFKTDPPASTTVPHVTPKTKVVKTTPGIFIHTNTVSVKNVRIGCGDGILNKRDYSDITCTPETDAFNPCEDIMGNETLRVLVWVVIVLALVGNMVVMIVLLFNWRKITVSKFLMCNLATADFLMGFYLLMIASEDIHTINEYFNFAIEWQYEGGCQVAGFITVFASELSVFTLSVITVERWYAISHAIHLTKRMNLKHASAIMVFGWIFAATLAMLPLIGVSNYGKTSLCLPFDTSKTAGAAYILFILIFNGVAFITICLCYFSMYVKVAGNNATAQTSDATIAKRMAVLVATDFACWAPIAFFGLTALGGAPFVDVTSAKILLVFFYPLNSCANPFLYAIITKQFRKDFFMMLSHYGFCEQRANRYKTHLSNNVSVSQSRSGNNLIHRLSDGSVLTTITDVMRISHVGLTPESTPKLESSKPDLKTRNKRNSKGKANKRLNADRTIQFDIDGIPKKSPLNSRTPQTISVNGSLTNSEREPLTPQQSPLQQRVRSASEYAELVPGDQKYLRDNRKVSHVTGISNYTSSTFFSDLDTSGVYSCSENVIGETDSDNNDSDKSSLNDSFQKHVRQTSSDKESGFHSGLPTPEPCPGDHRQLSKDRFFDILTKAPELILEESRV